MKKIIAWVLLCAFLFAAVSCQNTIGTEDVIPEESPLKVNVTIRAGEAFPEVTAFLKDGYTGELVTDPAGIDTSVAGLYDVVIRVNGREYTTGLVVEDATPPTGETAPVQIKPNGQVTAEDFFRTMEDDTAVTAEFAAAPETAAVGVYDVALVLSDASGNTAQFMEKLIVSELEPLTIEASAEPLTAEQIAPGREDATLSEKIVPNVPGTQIVSVTLGDQSQATLLMVQDTVAPTAEGVEKTAYLNYPMDPEKLVKNAADATQITYAYETEPDFTKEGTQQVTILLTDAGGNTAKVTSTITLVADTEAPVLYGLQDHMYFYKGGTISYLSTVYAEDNCCDAEDITIDVDKSAVDIYQLGEYEVTYTATDASGNSSQKTIIVELVEQTVTQEQLDAEVERVLAEIITDDMTMGEKAFAIYNYIRDNVVYVNHSDSTDYIGEAYNGLTKMRGDCFTFYASTDALLKAIGAETMKVCRKYNTTRPTNHYWLKVNLGTGWYHMDTCNTGPRNYEAFMRTDEEFTTRARTFWMFDSSLYPASPTKPYEKDF